MRDLKQRDPNIWLVAWASGHSPSGMYLDIVAKDNARTWHPRHFPISDSGPPLLPVVDGAAYQTEWSLGAKVGNQKDEDTQAWHDVPLPRNATLIVVASSSLLCFTRVRQFTVDNRY
jgi:hypothetical protein